MFSLAFEGSKVSNLTIANGTSANASLREVQWSNVTLERVGLGELQLDKSPSFSSRWCVIKSAVSHCLRNVAAVEISKLLHERTDNGLTEF